MPTKNTNIERRTSNAEHRSHAFDVQRSLFDVRSFFSTSQSDPSPARGGLRRSALPKPALGTGRVRAAARSSNPKSKTENPKSPPRGFTLIELLIVISIISVLLLLTVQVMGALLSNAREGATQVTIRKVQRMLNERAEALDRLTRRTGYLQSTSEYTGIANNLSAGDTNLQKILAHKLLAKKYFPQRFAEVFTTLQPNAASTWSNGDILYDFLTQSNVLGSLSVSADAFSTAEVKDTNGNGQPEFVDAWGNPLRFYRWPTRLFRRNPYWMDATNAYPIDATDIANVKVLLSTIPSFTGDPNVDWTRDPDDPLRKCSRFNPNGPPGPTQVDFENLGGTGSFHTPATYHIMLVVSAGPDGILGLYEPTDLTNNGHLGRVSDTNALLDDITFLNVRAGGK